MSTWERVSQDRGKWQLRATSIAQSYLDLWKAIESVVSEEVATEIMYKELEFKHERKSL